jgi:hypothetical protein
VHCLSSIHNFVETYGENEADELPKKIYPGALVPGNFNVTSPLTANGQIKDLTTTILIKPHNKT